VLWNSPPQASAGAALAVTTAIAAINPEIV
jgi:hypothetical protein